MRMLSTRVLGRRQVAVVAAALAAFGGFAVIRAQAPAEAHETVPPGPLNMTCTIGPITIPLPVDYVVNHEPDAPVAGEVFTIRTKSTAHATAPIEITGIRITIPVPFGVSGGGEIGVSGGDLTFVDQVNTADATVLTLAANPPVKATEMEMPELEIPVEISETHGGQITFEGPSKLDITIAGQTEPTVFCNADAGNPPLLGPLNVTGGNVVNPPPTTKKPAPPGGGGGGGAGEGGGGAGEGVVKASPKFTG